MESASRDRLILTFQDAIFEGVEIPCVVVRGHLDGPSIAIVAGVHGGEYPGPAAAIRLSREIDPSALSGTLVIVPIANPTSFRERTAFVTPEDGKNLNRVFPGNPDGTFSQVLAHRLLEQVVRPADVSIDLHSGDIFESLSPYTGYHDSNDPETRVLAERVARSFDVPVLMRYPVPTPPGHSLSQSAAVAGLASAFVEIGGNGLLLPEDERTVFDGLMNALVAAGCLSGEAKPTSAAVFQSAAAPVASVTGLWRRAVDLDQWVEAGRVLGVITDAFGDVQETVTVPVAGRVMYYLSSMSVREGETLVSIACPVD